MKLDPRIIEGKRPLSCLDTDEAKEFIGKEGYFTDCLAAFTNVRRYEKTWMLKAIDEKAQRCFKDADGVYWDFFLPSEWVQEKELQSRPYTLQEFVDNVGGVGDVVTYRVHDKSGTSKCEWTSLIVEIETCQNGESETFPIKIYIGESEFLLKELFEHCEYRKNGQWQPFGVKE